MREAERRKQRRAPLAMVGVAAGLLLVSASVAAWYFVVRDGSDDASGAPTSSAVVSASAEPERDPNDLGITDPARVDASALLGRARSRAAKWSSDARLVSLSAHPMKEGFADTTGSGRIELVYGKPVGELTPGSAVGPERLVITVSDGKTKISEATADGPGRIAGEPNCQSDEAWRKTIAAGVPSSEEMELRYEYSKTHGKSVWRGVVHRDGGAEPRPIDGWTCAILVR